jgi:hypothetical protein
MSLGTGVMMDVKIFLGLTYLKYNYHLTKG